MNKFKDFKTLASKAFLRLWSTNAEYIDQWLGPQIAEVTLNHVVDFNVTKLSTKSVLITAKWALTVGDRRRSMVGRPSCSFTF